MGVVSVGRGDEISSCPGDSAIVTCDGTFSAGRGWLATTPRANLHGYDWHAGCCKPGGSLVSYDAAIDRYVTLMLFLTNFSRSNGQVYASHPYLPSVAHEDLEFVITTMRQNAEIFVRSRLADGTGLPDLNKHD